MNSDEWCHTETNLTDSTMQGQKKRRRPPDDCLLFGLPTQKGLVPKPPLQRRSRLRFKVCNIAQTRNEGSDNILRLFEMVDSSEIQTNNVSEENFEEEYPTQGVLEKRQRNCVMNEHVGAVEIEIESGGKDTGVDDMYGKDLAAFEGSTSGEESIIEDSSTVDGNVNVPSWERIWGALMITGAHHLSREQYNAVRFSCTLNRKKKNGGEMHFNSMGLPDYRTFTRCTFLYYCDFLLLKVIWPN